MGKILDFNNFLNEEPDLSGMDREALLAYLEQLRQQIEDLDTVEPKNMNSEAYEEWGDLHEELEDQIDEVLELLDEM